MCRSSNKGDESGNKSSFYDKHLGNKASAQRTEMNSIMSGNRFSSGITIGKTSITIGRKKGSARSQPTHNDDSDEERMASESEEWVKNKRNRGQKKMKEGEEPGNEPDELEKPKKKKKTDVERAWLNYSQNAYSQGVALWGGVATTVKPLKSGKKKELKIIGKYGMDKNPAKHIALILPQCPGLETLTLKDGACAAVGGGEDQSSSSVYGISYIAASLSDSSLSMRLKVLCLHKNTIKCDGMKALAPALRKMKSLTTLLLTNIELGTEGTKELSFVLSEMRALTKLDLSSNRMGNDGANALANVLPDCKRLAELIVKTQITSTFSNTSIHSSGAEGFANALPDCKSLTKFDISGNKIKNEGALLLGEALSNVYALTSINIKNNSITEGKKKDDEDAKAFWKIGRAHV
jgi:hypothetical protein